MRELTSGFTSSLSSGAGSSSSGVTPVVSGLVATRRGRWLSAGAGGVAGGTGRGGVRHRGWVAEQVTARVTRGTVGTDGGGDRGTLQAVSEQSLGFTKSGKLVDLLVTVGAAGDGGSGLWLAG